MSDHQPYRPPDHPPPPGAVPPPPGGSTPPAPGWGVPAAAPAPGSMPGPVPGAPPPWAPTPGMLGAAHKPGAMPLRPLGLGDILDAAFRIIRFNPKATVGAAVLVSSVVMAIPIAFTALLTFTVGTGLGADVELDSTSASLELTGLLGSMGSLLVGAVLLQVGLIFVTGMVAHVTAAAAVGRRLSLGQAWACTRGKRWRLLGLTVTINLLWLLALAVYALLWVVVVTTTDQVGVVVAFGLVTVPAFVAASLFYWIRVYYLPAPVLMLEDVGILGAIGRGFRLTRRQFWRTFGIALLTLLLASIAGYMLAVPLGFAGQVAALAMPQLATLSLVATQAVSTVVSSAFVAPFTAAVASLQYLDQRMRKEAYDVELLTQAGIIPS